MLPCFRALAMILLPCSIACSGVSAEIVTSSWTKYWCSIHSAPISLGVQAPAAGHQVCVVGDQQLIIDVAGPAGDDEPAHGPPVPVIVHDRFLHSVIPSLTMSDEERSL